MKMKNTITVDDPEILNIDPVQKLWMYENWLADQKEKAELAKNHAYLLASFSNPEAVKQIIGDNNTHISSDDEFEESSRLVRELNEKSIISNNIISKRRKRRSIKE
jgi:hypothetical protein